MLFNQNLEFFEMIHYYITNSLRKYKFLVNFVSLKKKYNMIYKKYKILTYKYKSNYF